VNNENLRDYENPTRRRDFFVYEAQTLVLAAAGNAVDTVQIQADADFILQKLTYECDIAGATQTISTRTVPNVTVQITDTGSNRQLFQQPVPIPSIFGTGELPFILPNPRLFMKTSVIQVDFTSFEAAVTPSIRLAFIGYKFYRY